MVAPNYFEYTTDTSGTIIFLARATNQEYIFDTRPQGTLTVYHDNEEVLNWNYGYTTNAMEYYNVDFRRHITAGTHRFTGSLTCSTDPKYITGQTSVFLLFIPD